MPPSPKPKRWRKMRNMSSVQMPSVFYIENEEGDSSNDLSLVAVGASVGVLVLLSVGIGVWLSK